MLEEGEIPAPWSWARPALEQVGGEFPTRARSRRSTIFTLAPSGQGCARIASSDKAMELGPALGQHEHDLDRLPLLHRQR